MKKFLFFFLFIPLGFFLYPEYITITSPNSSSNLKSGFHMYITWQSSFSYRDSVEIKLYNQDRSVLFESITNTTRNDGSFKWLIPASLQGRFTIRVRKLHSNTYFWSQIFRISKMKTMNAQSVTPGVLQSDIPEQKPDLMVESITITPVKPLQNEFVWHKAVIVNKGPGKARNFYVTHRLYTPDQPEGRVILRKMISEELGFNKRTSVQQKVRAVKNGFYKSIFEVNKLRRFIISESNTENNMSQKTYVVYPLPDLIVCFSTSMRPAVGENYGIQAIIKNIGTLRSGPCRLRFKVRNRKTTLHDVPEIPAGGTYVVTRKQSWNTSGTKHISATIDCFDKVREIDDRLNTVAGTLFVRLPHHDKYTTGGLKCSNGVNY